jgi:hypothetical protein
MRSFLFAAIAASLPLAAQAAPVDLTGWIENGYKGNNGAGTWTVQPGNNSVVQSINGQPTVFFDPSANDLGKTLTGTVEVQTTGDDDFIGFVLGYNDGEFNSTAADFWLIDWKQTDQSPGVDGLALSHVTGDITASPSANDFWQHVNVVNEVQRGATLGSTGWADNTEYTFELTFTPSLIAISVNGTPQLSYTSAAHGSSFTGGAFGFYNYSQNAVRYAGLTEDAAVVPLPASLPLLLAGLGGIAALRRRRRR